MKKKKSFHVTKSDHLHFCLDFSRNRTLEFQIVYSWNLYETYPSRMTNWEKTINNWTLFITSASLSTTWSWNRVLSTKQQEFIFFKHHLDWFARTTAPAERLCNSDAARRATEWHAWLEKQNPALLIFPSLHLIIATANSAQNLGHNHRLLFDPDHFSSWSWSECRARIMQSLPPTCSLSA